MKALFYTDVMSSEIRETNAPVAGDGQAVIDISCCGICGSDMHAWHGHDPRRVPPLILGHEAVGIARGGRFDGKRVAINPLMTCDDCVACHSGTEHLCSSRELIGMRVPGAFAQQVAIDEDNLTPLPDHLSDLDAALAEPLACGVHAVNLLHHDQPNDKRVIILGGGAIGLLCGFVLAHLGYQQIDIAEMNGLRREILAGLKGVSPYDPRDIKMADGSADIIIDAVGSGVTRAEASRLTRPGGQIVHIGLQDNLEGLDTRRLTLQEISFRGTYCYRCDDFQQALDLLADGHISAAGWSEVRPLDEGFGAFQDIHNGKAHPKIILDTH